MKLYHFNMQNYKNPATATNPPTFILENTNFEDKFIPETYFILELLCFEDILQKNSIFVWQKIKDCIYVEF